MTFKQSLAKSLTKAAVLMAAILAFVIPFSIGGGFDVEQGTGDEAMAIRPQVTDSPAAIAAKHDCWTGEAPADMAGQMPGHVVVSTPNGDVVYGGPRLVSKALSQIFEGADHNLNVHGFCR